MKTILPFQTQSATKTGEENVLSLISDFSMDRKALFTIYFLTEDKFLQFMNSFKVTQVTYSEIDLE